MRSVILILFFNQLCSNLGSNITSSCGLDNSPVSAVYEGVAAIETYPWMGLLYYPMARVRFTTSVVLITRQIVIGVAGEIDKLPKTDFRVRARVVLGHRCGVGSEIKVRDYTYHPEYVKYSFSALAMLQLETDHVKTELRPICQPPAHFTEPHFHAMTMTESCENPKVRIHRMRYVNINECRKFYRRTGMAQDNMWPVHAACARSVSGGRCVWRSGSVLAVKQDGRWRLLGFSVYGPGCGDPARFLDYGMYHGWVQLSSSTAGQPAITRMGDNHLVLRRSLGSIQRYGPCDPEEKISELYSDQVSIFYGPGKHNARYNVTLVAGVEYSCITFKAQHHTTISKVFGKHGKIIPKPKIHLRRWCAKSTGMCHGFQHIEIQFYVAIEFFDSVEFAMYAYGREAKVIAALAALKFSNQNRGVYPEVMPYAEVMTTIVRPQKSTSSYIWFYSHHLG